MPKEFIKEIEETIKNYQSDYSDSDILRDKLLEILGNALDQINALEESLAEEQEMMKNPEFYEEYKLEAYHVI
jgi:hypothetical protein